MDQKLKVKYRKSDKKYFVDYAKVLNRQETRFELFEQINVVEDIMVLIDTSLNKADPKVVNEHFYDLTSQGSLHIIENYLEESSFDYKIRRVKRQVPRTVLGFTTSKMDVVEDILIAVSIEKGQLTHEFFEYLMCTHDIMIGINPTVPISTILRDFSSAEFQRINEIEKFEMTLIDSHWMAYCYTDFNFTLV